LPPAGALVMQPSTAMSSSSNPTMRSYCAPPSAGSTSQLHGGRAHRLRGVPVGLGLRGTAAFGHDRNGGAGLYQLNHTNWTDAGGPSGPRPHPRPEPDVRQPDESLRRAIP
jgi:hypothetical protein